MRPHYSIDYLDRVFGGKNVFDLWSLLTTLERHVPLPQKSWLFCRLLEWMSSTRSGVWTYYEATSETAQSHISSVIRHYPELGSFSEYYDRGMMTWTSEQEIGHVDRWIDSHEAQIHSSLMQLARDEKPLIMKLNAEPEPTPNGVPGTSIATPDGESHR